MNNMSPCAELRNNRSSCPELCLRKGVLKICSEFTGEHPWRSTISIKLLEITLRHGCSPTNLLHIFRTPANLLKSHFGVGVLFCKFAAKKQENFKFAYTLVEIICFSVINLPHDTKHDTWHNFFVLLLSYLHFSIYFKGLLWNNGIEQVLQVFYTFFKSV